MNQRNVPRSGEFYRHFKNNFYQIIAIATHTETREEMVVYQALYGDFGIYVRPLSMFMEPVDKEKYPEASQEYRFELVEKPECSKEAGESTQISETKHTSISMPNEKTESANLESGMIDQVVERFLDADSYREKIQIIRSNRSEITQKQLINMAVVSDVVFRDDDSFEEQFSWLLQCLETKARFEIKR